MTRAVRYTIFRAAMHGRKQLNNVDVKTLDLAHQYAKHRLSRDAEIVEYDVLPLGCEAIARVGRIAAGTGKVTWRRERRRPARRYLSDELTK